jgi:predicted SAM-dependent methyltransferase
VSIINWELHQKLMEQPKTIKVCTGIGLNQFFPEWITIEIPQDTIITDTIHGTDELEKNKEK